jgi:hypothetical protein
MNLRRFNHQGDGLAPSLPTLHHVLVDTGGVRAQ